MTQPPDAPRRGGTVPRPPARSGAAGVAEPNLATDFGPGVAAAAHPSPVTHAQPGPAAAAGPAGAPRGAPAPEHGATQGPTLPVTLRTALTSRPRVYLRSPWPWRALSWGLQACVAGWILSGLVAAVVAPPLTGTWSLTQAGGIGLELLMVLLLVATSVLIAVWQRRAVRIIGAPRVVAGYPMRTPGMQPWTVSLRQVVLGVFRHGAVARDVAYCLALLPVAAVLTALTYLMPFWLAAVGVTTWQVVIGDVPGPSPWAVWLSAAGMLLGIVASPWLWGWLALAGNALAHGIMDPGRDHARTQSAQLAASRRRLAQAFAAERRRIERDLHDGVQQRIVAQAMTLGMAQLALQELSELQAHPGAGTVPAPAAAMGAGGPGLTQQDPGPAGGAHDGRAPAGPPVPDPAAAGELRRREAADRIADAAALVAQAKAENAAILRDLRELVRSISPQVLRDQGLAAALDEVAGNAALPVECQVDLPVRPDELIESTAYFVVLEALTNAAKHAGAQRVQVRVRPWAGGVDVTVRDDGRGGAHFTPDGGLAGLVERVESAGGTLEVSSPEGGPTVVRALLPGQAPAAQLDGESDHEEPPGRGVGSTDAAQRGRGAGRRGTVSAGRGAEGDRVAEDGSGAGRDRGAGTGASGSGARQSGVAGPDGAARAGSNGAVSRGVGTQPGDRAGDSTRTEEREGR